MREVGGADKVGIFDVELMDKILELFGVFVDVGIGSKAILESLFVDFITMFVGTGLEADIVFRTPGLHPDVPALQEVVARGAELTSEMEVFLSLCPATVIAITNAGKSPIRACSDILLHTSSDETKYNILALNSRIAQLAIINVIYYYVVVHRSEEAAEAIRETERSLKSKKF